MILRCSRCGKEKDSSLFYNDKTKKSGKSSWCKVCHKLYSKLAQRKFKRLCVEYKGSTCAICGIVGHPAIFDFHHENPDEKEFAISSYKGRNGSQLTEEVTRELDKCSLVCSNCHRYIHYDDELES